MVRDGKQPAIQAPAIRKNPPRAAVGANIQATNDPVPDEVARAFTGVRIWQVLGALHAYFDMVGDPEGLRVRTAVPDQLGRVAQTAGRLGRGTTVVG